MRWISETLGFVHMMREFHTHDWGRIIHRVDSSACRAIMLRRGCGGPKHITVNSLWVQDAVSDYSNFSRENFARCDACAYLCLSIQRGRFKEAPRRVKWIPKYGVRGGRALMRGPWAGWRGKWRPRENSTS